MEHERYCNLIATSGRTTKEQETSPTNEARDAQGSKTRPNKAPGPAGRTERQTYVLTMARNVCEKSPDFQINTTFSDLRCATWHLQLLSLVHCWYPTSLSPSQNQTNHLSCFLSLHTSDKLHRMFISMALWIPRTRCPRSQFLECCRNLPGGAVCECIFSQRRWYSNLEETRADVFSCFAKV